jgi:hypothetical protein
MGVATKRRSRALHAPALLMLGSIGLAIAGTVNATTATALPTDAATPTFQYSSLVGAIGIQTALKQNPEPSSVPDLTDVQTPSSDGQLDSFGTSTANGHVGNLNGLGQLPSLICLASAAACNAIPISTLTGGLIQSFPPSDPLDAASAYPQVQSATAPHVGSKVASASFRSSGLAVGVGTASSTAKALSTSTDAQDGNLSLMSAITIGSVHTTTSQVATASNLTTTATSTLSDIGIGTGNLLHIGSIKSTVTVVSSPTKKPTDTASTQIGNVSVLGLPATIDHNGISLGKTGKPIAVINAVQSLLNKTLKKAGFALKLADVSRKDNSNGHVVTVNGVELTFDRTVSGTPPITIGLPAGIPCPIESITSKLPVDPCAGVGLSLNAKYHGQVALAQVSVTSLAAPGSKLPGTTGPGNPVSAGVGGGLPGGTSQGLPGGSPPSQIAPTGTSQAPSFPAKTVAAADPLAGVSKRLLWFFPLMMVGLLGIVGRLRTPARLPRKG